MQKLAEVCIRRPVFAAMIVLALVVVGAASYFRLGVDRFPSVELPTVSVRTELPGASVEEMETQVTQKIEEAVNTVQGITELRSITGPGTSIVIVTFALDRTIDVAAQDVRDKVLNAVRNLPRDVRPPAVSKFDNDQSPVLTLALSGDRSLRELTEIADKTVKVDLERSLGVGEVRLVGGLERAVNIWVDADRLAAYQIPITAVRDAIVRQNADLPGGNVTAGRQEQSLRTMGRVADPRAFNDLVVATVNGAPIRVRDIGRAEDGTKEQRSAVRAERRAHRHPGGPAAVGREHGRRHRGGQGEPGPARAAQLPADVKLEIIRDQSRYIYAALHEINLHLVLGSILASLVVLAFMRSWRSTIIAAVAIPASVISAFGMMWALGFTLNSVTMLALVLMVGIVIDDAIVVLENIFRFVEEKQMPPFEAARAATADIGLAVMATTFSPGGHLRAGVVHVVGLRPLPLPVRPHRGGVGAGEPARVVHPHADDERPHAPGGGRGGRRRTTRRRSRRRLLRAGSTAPTRGCCAWPCTPVGRVVVVGLALAVVAVDGAALRHGEAGVHADRRGRGGVRGARTRARGHEPGRHGRGHAGAWTARCRGRPRRPAGAPRPPAAASWAGSTRATCTCASPRTTSAR